MNRVALIMIARNEARCIERCLTSALPWVDEMWVLDTGSSDSTPLIAQRCGAKVANFTWIDDFAAARNASLALTNAQWRLVLDADEWIVSHASSLNQLRARDPSFIGQLTVMNMFNDAKGAVNHAPSCLPRILPIGVQYEGRIHEQPQAILPRELLPLVVGHDGYLSQHTKIKQGRNERLLHLALQAQPNDTYLRYQLGKDFEVREQFDEAMPHYMQAYREGSPHAAWRHDLVIRLLFTLKKLKQFEPAIQLAKSEMPHWANSPDFYFTLGDLLLDWAVSNPQQATELLPMIESSWLRAIEIGEQPKLQDSVCGRGSYLAAHNLSVLFASLGQEALATEWRMREKQLRQSAAQTSL